MTSMFDAETSFIGIKEEEVLELGLEVFVISLTLAWLFPWMVSSDLQTGVYVHSDVILELSKIQTDWANIRSLRLACWVVLNIKVIPNTLPSTDNLIISKVIIRIGNVEGRILRIILRSDI